MERCFILSPFFIGNPEPGLEILAADSFWIINKPSLPNGNPLTRMKIIYSSLSRIVYNAIMTGRLPVSIAGDCLSSIGILSGLIKAKVFPTLIWIDAHGDFHTSETSISGFFGGMPLAMISGRGEQAIIKGVGLKPFPEKKIILINARDLDKTEIDPLSKSGIYHYKGKLKNFKIPKGSLYIHFDTDVIDIKDAPAMLYPSPNGLTKEELRAFFKRISKKGQISAVSLSSWNPSLDKDGKSRETSMNLLRDLLPRK